MDTYKDYLLSLRDSLIRCGVGLPVKDEYSYEDLFNLSEIIAQVLWFYSILAVVNSRNKLRGFLLPLDATYKSKMRSIFYSEYCETKKGFRNILVEEPEEEGDTQSEGINIDDNVDPEFMEERVGGKEKVGNNEITYITEDEMSIDENGFLYYIEEEEVTDKEPEIQEWSDTDIEEDGESDFSDWSEDEETYTEAEEDDENDFPDWGNGDDEGDDQGEVEQEEGNEDSEEDFPDWSDKEEDEIKNLDYPDWGNKDDGEDDEEDFPEWGDDDSDTDNIDDVQGDEDIEDFPDWGDEEDEEPKPVIEDIGLQDEDEEEDFPDWADDEEDNVTNEDEDEEDFPDWSDNDEEDIPNPEDLDWSDDNEEDEAEEDFPDWSDVEEDESGDSNPVVQKQRDEYNKTPSGGARGSKPTGNKKNTSVKKDPNEELAKALEGAVVGIIDFGKKSGKKTLARLLKS